MRKKSGRGRRRRPAAAKRRQRPHSWALAFGHGDDELRGLSSEARDGLDYARQIARVARERRLFALDGDVLPEPLTVERIAKEEGTSPVSIYKAIKQSRIEIFGRDLKDSAIYYRLKERRRRGVRVCVEPDCGRRISALSDGRRRYCDVHGSGAARIRRHRRRATELAGV